MAAQGDSFGYAQEQFTKEYDKVEADENRKSWESLWRRAVAYGFKLLAVIGALAVAAGLSGQAAQAIGVCIAVAVALDAIFSNHERLIVVVTARNAYRRLLNQVRREHQRELAPILRQKVPDEEKARANAAALCQRLLARLHEGCEEIEEALRAADLKALRALSMEEHR
jgi:hypothetical protein